MSPGQMCLRFKCVSDRMCLRLKCVSGSNVSPAQKCVSSSNVSPAQKCVSGSNVSQKWKSLLKIQMCLQNRNVSPKWKVSPKFKCVSEQILPRGEIVKVEMPWKFGFEFSLIHQWYLQLRMVPLKVSLDIFAGFNMLALRAQHDSMPLLEK